MRKSLCAAILTGGIISVAIAADPVVMTVNGIDVPRSEFEYLYHKNNQQQTNPQPLEEYVEMFKIYKLKVADAKNMGIDTTENFRKEMAQYRRELAAPFIADTIFLNDMVTETFNNSQEEVSVSLIKVSKPRNPLEYFKVKQQTDSLRQLIKAGADFAEVARNNSTDIAAPEGGYHGYMTAGRLPYNFEEALYNTPEGEVSEIIDLQDGFYFLQPGPRRPSRGKVEVAHIVKLFPQNATDEQKAAIKTEIDSIYALLIEKPFGFGEIARINSDDKASARQDGKLPRFGAGEMVPQFEDVAFALKEGEMSEPFETRFGWHIIKKFNNYPSATYDEIKENVTLRASNPQDSRYKKIKEHEFGKLVKKHGGKINEANLNKLKNEALTAGLDSMYLANWTQMPNSETEMASVGDRKVTAEDIIFPIRKLNSMEPAALPELIDQSLQRVMQNYALEAEEDLLYATEPEYRFLMDEYTDGSLLYEVSVEKVWDKAAKDNAGIDRFFKENKSRYKFAKPRVKGILVQSENDSISDLVRTRLKEMNEGKNELAVVKKEFSGKASIEPIVAEEGVNPLVDYLAYGGAPAKPKITNYKTAFLFEPRMIIEPEEPSDIKSQVTTDYQNYLEENWVNEMIQKYPVVIYYDEIMKVE